MNAISLYRIARWLYLHKIPVFPKLIQVLIFYMYNTKITPDTEIGKGTYMVCRGVSSVLIPGCKIGNNCTLGLRLSIVRLFPYKNVANIGDNVWIGPNVVISGPVIIEDDVIIAANSFVNKSIPSGAIVAGCPAKIIGWKKDLKYNIEENPKYLEGTLPYLNNNAK